MKNPTAAIIGSFNQNFRQVIKAHEVFSQNGYEVIFPKNSKITKPGIDFVRLHSDNPKLSDSQIESLALKKILSSDFIYVVASGGYVGKTVSYEIGRALAANRPIYFSEALVDLPIAVPSAHIAGPQALVIKLKSTRPKPIMVKLTIADYQVWIKRLISERGFDRETVSEVFMLLVEEIGELGKSIRKSTGIKVDKKSRRHDLEEESADVLWLLLDLCNRLNIDLEKAFWVKEKKNQKRQWS